MGIIHTPRTLYSIAKGFLQRSKGPPGIGNDNPHIYTSRVGLFDVDYLGHMNNASYLSHAEYARWQMCAENGLIAAMWNHNMHFVVLGSTIRYRKELRPLFRSFQIDTELSAIDDGNMWIVHNFRHAKDKANKRIMAQVLVQGAAVRGRTRINPADLLVNHVGIDSSLVDTLRLSAATQDEHNLAMIQNYQALQETFQTTASKDDSKHK